MSLNYLPKAAAGSLLLAGANHLLDDVGASTTSCRPSNRTTEELDMTLDDSRNGVSLSKKLGSLMYRPLSVLDEKNYLNEEGMDVDDEDLQPRLLTYGINHSRVLDPIPRVVLRHPDEQTRHYYWGVEREIIGRWPSVEDEAVDLESIFLLVSLANECFEVARESYRVSTARNETNWFEKSLTWNNQRFRRIYRSVLGLICGQY